MKKENKALWMIPESLEIEHLIADIRRKVAIEPESTRKSVVSWYDTFDRRLYCRNPHLSYDLSGRFYRGSKDCGPNAT